jgi:coenzyme F420-reducing hydrogenase delta subunit
MRLQYPFSVKVVQLPCSGRVDIIHLLRSFEDGADGVYVAGCLEGDCHYLTGNFKARRKVNYVKKVLETLGIEPERIEMFNMSSADGPRFAAVAREFTAKIAELGSSPLNSAKVA